MQLVVLACHTHLLALPPGPLGGGGGLIHSSRCSQTVKRMPNLNFNTPATPTLRSASHHMAKCQSCALKQKQKKQMKMMMMMMIMLLLLLDCRLFLLLLLPCGICRHRKKWQMAIPKQLWLVLLQQQLVARRSRLSNCHCTD